MAPKAAKEKAKTIPIKKKEPWIEAIEKEGDSDSIQDLPREEFTGGYDTDNSDYIMPDQNLDPGEEEEEDAVYSSHKRGTRISLRGSSMNLSRRLSGGTKAYSERPSDYQRDSKGSFYLKRRIKRKQKEAKEASCLAQGNKG